MRRRRAITYDDRRLNWRDPNMPVLREMKFGCGEQRLVEVPPEEEQDHCAGVVDKKPVPSWFEDETYNLARSGAKRRRR